MEKIKEKIEEFYGFVRYELGVNITVSRWQSFGRWFKAEVFRSDDCINICADFPFSGVTIKIGYLPPWRGGRLSFSRVNAKE